MVCFYNLKYTFLNAYQTYVFKTSNFSYIYFYLVQKKYEINLNYIFK